MVKLKKRKVSGNMTDSKRQTIFQKYHGHCAYCGRPLKMKAMTVDHLVPKSKGGVSATEALIKTLIYDFIFFRKSNHEDTLYLCDVVIPDPVAGIEVQTLTRVGRVY